MEIAQALSEFYKDLYHDSDPYNIENKIQIFLKKLNLPTLSEEEATEITQPISCQEISNTIKRLKNNKSPASDRFPREFSKYLIN